MVVVAGIGIASLQCVQRVSEMLEVPCAVEVNVSPRGQIGYPDEGIDAGKYVLRFFSVLYRRPR